MEDLFTKARNAGYEMMERTRDNTRTHVRTGITNVDLEKEICFVTSVDLCCNPLYGYTYFLATVSNSI